jgi:hypothetical protein
LSAARRLGVLHQFTVARTDAQVAQLSHDRWPAAHPPALKPTDRRLGLQPRGKDPVQRSRQPTRNKTRRPVTERGNAATVLGGTEPDLPPGSTRRSRYSRSGEDVAHETEEIHDRIVPCR